MRTTNRRPIATMLVLVGATMLFTGCGDEGAHLPAGMTGSSAAYTSGGNDVISDVLGGDPGPQTAGVSTMVDDPVLAGYDGVDSVDGLGTDDVYNRAISDWNENEGSLGGLDTDLDDDFGYDDGLMPANYGGGGWGDSLYGYGGNLLGAASYGNGWGNGGLVNAGFEDPGLVDPGFADAGFDDPGLMDAGFDPGFEDPGFVDAGFDDPGFVDAGFDPGVADAGFVDAGFDPGFVDAGVADVGVVDASFDAGIVF